MINKDIDPIAEMLGFCPPRHARFLGGGPKLSAGLSVDEREQLLEKENELARLRDEEQRDFMLQQEEMRVAREESQRLLTQQEEASRTAELERLETAGAEVAEDISEPADTDTSVADMFAALAFGTEFIGDEEEAAPSEPVYPE